VVGRLWVASGNHFGPYNPGVATIVTGSAGRVRSFDLARGVAVVCMVLVHVLWHWGSRDVIATPFGTAVSVLGGPPAAPVFMTLMGASIAFSSRADPRWLVIRGVTLIAAGYLLNLARGALPAALGLASGVVTAEDIAPFTPLRLLTSVDILQLAGCSLIVIGALRRLGPPNLGWVGVGIAMVAFAPAVVGLRTAVPILDGLLTPVWGDAPNVFYAVFPWAVYPLVGAVVGEGVARSGDRPATLRAIGMAGFGLCATGLVAIAVTRPAIDVVTYWRHPPALAMASLGFVLAWIWACDVIIRRLPDLGGFQLLERAGRRVTVLYVIHWLIVGWGVALVGFQDLGLAAVMVAMAITVGLTWFIGTRTFVRPRLAMAGA